MRIAFAALLFASVATPAMAQSVQYYGDLAISPDGGRIATVETVAASGKDGKPAYDTRIVLRSVSDGHILAQVDPCDDCRYSDLTFGPDGSLAFLARNGNQVQLETAKGNQSHVVATVDGIASTPRYSPDGKRIALLVTIGAQKEAGATQAGVRQVGEIGEHYDERRLAVFDATGTVAADAVKPLSPAGRYIYEYDWAPDGRTLVATSAQGNGDANWWVATLDAIDAQTGALRQIAKPTTQLNMPVVSPDGKTVAYIGGLMSDFGSIGGDIYTVPLAGGTPKDITDGSTTTNVSLAWTQGGMRTTALNSDTLEVAALSPTGQAGKPFFARKASFSAGDGRVVYSRDGRVMATVVQDFTHAPAIFAGPVAAPKQITHDNDDVAPIVDAKSVEWTNEGYHVQGWLLSPRGADLSKKAPMITIVHGGPAAASGPRFVQGGIAKEMMDKGYWIFLPNPRGSYGQGEKFVQANKRDFGFGDLRDILAGIDAVEKVAPIDDNRLGLMGGSYGGFMAMFANTQTDRFKALVANAGLSDWISYYGTNGINTWMVPYFGATMYDDPDIYWKVSAIKYAHKAHTPTLITVGERDIEVPPTQSVEWWNALKAMGVPTSLVIYEGEGHGIRDPQHRADVERRTLAWFDKYLGVDSGK